jgi:hypothetical protein
MLAQPGRASDVRSLVGAHPSALEVLESHYIFLETSGRMAVDFETAMTAIRRAHLISDVQDAYARLLPPGEEPEFGVFQTSSNTFFYVNRRGQRSDVVELCRSRMSDRRFDIVYHVRGHRFFGDFQSLIHVTVSSPPGPGVEYGVDVYAYPENVISRFVARHLGIVERYFEQKTVSVVGIATEICRALCGTPEPGPPVTPGALAGPPGSTPALSP